MRVVGIWLPIAACAEHCPVPAFPFYPTRCLVVTYCPSCWDVLRGVRYYTPAAAWPTPGWGRPGSSIRAAQ
eukprot:1232244-Rhodomonas_salina.1